MKQDPKKVRPVKLVRVSDVRPDPKNPRRHSRQQIRAIARSIEGFSFTTPILVDRNLQIIAGHGRYEASKLLGLDRIPIIELEHLTPAQARACMLADNKLTDRSSWNDHALAILLNEMSPSAEVDIELTAFEQPERDARILSIADTEDAESADEFEVSKAPNVTQLGDLWSLGPHRVLCDSALDALAYEKLFKDEQRKAAAIFTDPPYNVPVDGHCTGKGRTKHREFPMASGEMSDAEFEAFLKTALGHGAESSAAGALIYACIDWRHVCHMQSAAQAIGLENINLCVWVKSNGGMGSLYRSCHEFVCVFKNGTERSVNNVQLGRFGRNRTNVWNYPSLSFSQRAKANRLHPTVKPILLVSDAIQDSTNRGDLVLDPFLGSGTSLLASQRTGRQCFGIELDPLYVDTIIERWQRMTGLEAVDQAGATYAVRRAVQGGNT